MPEPIYVPERLAWPSNSMSPPPSELIVPVEMNMALMIEVTPVEVFQNVPALTNLDPADSPRPKPLPSLTIQVAPVRLLITAADEEASPIVTVPPDCVTVPELTQWTLPPIVATATLVAPRVPNASTPSTAAFCSDVAPETDNVPPWRLSASSTSERAPIRSPATSKVTVSDGVASMITSSPAVGLAFRLQFEATDQLPDALAIQLSVAGADAEFAIATSRLFQPSASPIRQVISKE